MPNRKKVKILLPLCNKYLLACLLALLLLNGCSGVPSRDDKTGKKEQSLPPDFEKALVLMRSGDYAAAIPVLRDFSDKNPELAGPHINLGIAYQNTGDKDAALAALNQAVELNPGNPVAHLQRGILLREQGDFKAALDAYNQALKLQPDYALAHRNIGILYDLYLQQPGQALTHYQRYLDLVVEPDKTVNSWVVDLQRRTGSAQASAQ
jgi:tetratricopeptide (TPR) repeat protein